MFNGGQQMTTQLKCNECGEVMFEDEVFISADDIECCSECQSDSLSERQVDEEAAEEMLELATARMNAWFIDRVLEGA